MFMTTRSPGVAKQMLKLIKAELTSLTRATASRTSRILGSIRPNSRNRGFKIKRVLAA